MKKLITILLVAVVFTACDEASQNQIANIKTVSQRIEDLGKSVDAIKAMEESEALFKEDEFLLEYEYPIRDNESYVITYRFHNNACNEIKIDTYLNKESHTKKVQAEIMADIANNDEFGRGNIKNDIIKWTSKTRKVKLELNAQSIERGTISLVIHSK